MNSEPGGPPSTKRTIRPRPTLRAPTTSLRSWPQTNPGASVCTGRIVLRIARYRERPLPKPTAGSGRANEMPAPKSGPSFAISATPFSATAVPSERAASMSIADSVMTMRSILRWLRVRHIKGRGIRNARELEFCFPDAIAEIRRNAILAAAAEAERIFAIEAMTVPGIERVISKLISDGVSVEEAVDRVHEARARLDANVIEFGPWLERKQSRAA